MFPVYETHTVGVAYSVHPDEVASRAIGQTLETAQQQSDLPQQVDVLQVLSGTQRIPEGGVNMVVALSAACGLPAPEGVEIPAWQLQLARDVVERLGLNDYVLDIHGIAQHGESHAWISPARSFSPRFLGFLRHTLGIRNLVVFDEGLVAQIDDSAMIEVQQDDEHLAADEWPEMIRQLVGGQITPATAGDFIWWRHIRSLTREEAAEYSIADKDFRPFREEVRVLSRKLFKGACRVYFSSYNHLPGRFHAEMVVPIDPPILRLRDANET